MESATPREILPGRCRRRTWRSCASISTPSTHSCEGNFSSEAWLALWDEEAEFYPLRAQLEGESYLGHDGLMRFVAELTEDFEEVRFEIGETRDAGEQVVGIGRFRARGRASGVDINVPIGAVQRVRRGKIVYTRLFSEPADALEAAGLRE